MRIPRGLVVVRAIALACCLTACPAKYAAWLVPDAARANPTFGIGLSPENADNPYAVQRVRVSTCSAFRQDMTWIRGRAVWVALATDPVPSSPHAARVLYGAAPRGMRDSLAAAPLVPGCYVFGVEARPGSAQVQFWVDRDGTVREPTRAELDSMSADRLVGSIMTRSADAQAAATCRVGYGNARSLSDSQRVDAWIGYDTTRHASLTCADLRDLSPGDVAQPRTP